MATLNISTSIATALATVALVYMTWVLARETRVLSRATSRAHVTITLEPNLWAPQTMDIVAVNSGNAPAYDIMATFDPPLPSETDTARLQANLETPFRKISILRPAQTMRSSLCEFSRISGVNYSVAITWKALPDAKYREVLTYSLSGQDYASVSYVHALSPINEMAKQLKGLRDDWRSVARGTRRVKADVFDQKDRDTTAAKLKEIAKIEEESSG